MVNLRRISTSRWWHKKKPWILFCLFLFLVFVRMSKGAFYKDFYYFISKPFWPGQFQKEIINNSLDQELFVKLNLLKKDNKRLRETLLIQDLSDANNLTASVISRKTGTWWRQLLLNKGSNNGVKIGSAVIGPGGLLGRVKSTTNFTSSVILLTSPESKVGVLVDRAQVNALLVGSGDYSPRLIFYNNNVDVKVGDVVSSSPASTLLPPNIPIGIIQSVDKTFRSKKTANVLLFGKPQVIDWVNILNTNE